MNAFLWLVAQCILLFVVLFAGWQAWGDAGNQSLSITCGGLMFLSLTIAVKGFRDLGKNLSPGPLPSSGNTLVTEGIYSHVRHPLYSSLVILATGWSFFTQSFGAGFGTLALLVFLLVKSRAEEIGLKKIHSGYDEYVKRTGAFVPRLLTQKNYNQRTR